MKFALWVAIGGVMAAAGPAVAGDADCIRARDQHADFKAILDNDPSGKPQFETVKHGADGMVTITRWVNGEKRGTRKSLHGAFTKVIEFQSGTFRQETGLAASIDLATLFPLHAGQEAAYRVAVARSGRFDPKFFTVKIAVGNPREIVIGGCKVQALEITYDSRGTGPDDPAVKSTSAYAPALEYVLGSTSHVTLRDKITDNNTRVQAIEAWSE